MVLLAVSPAIAGAETEPQPTFIKSIDRMMVELRPHSAHASATIKKEYRDHMNLLVLNQFAALEAGLANGGLVPLPGDPLRFNVKPRVDGMFPIGEKDLANQSSYIAARPAAIGALLEIASRVRSGPIEVTSLVRHSEYQGALRATNGNANTSVPTHTMGLAFDIALVNTSLSTIREIRDVLTEMQKAGDILFIGERQQLVFHVVPHPSRLGHFAAVYAQAIAHDTPGAYEISSWSLSHAASDTPQASVAVDIVQIRPTDEFAKEWWSVDDVGSDLTIQVAAPAPGSTLEADERSVFGRFAARCVTLLTGLLQSAWNAVA